MAAVIPVWVPTGVSVDSGRDGAVLVFGECEELRLSRGEAEALAGALERAAMSKSWREKIEVEERGEDAPVVLRMDDGPVALAFGRDGESFRVETYFWPDAAAELADALRRA